ncbi:MAG: O-antigen ligase family protein [Acidobacteriota bacterium]|nr:O-antigen ligase family protein [Acidobacteriota bacterium]
MRGTPPRNLVSGIALAILPAMVLLRLRGFVAPHEDPRQAVLIAAGAAIFLAGVPRRRAGRLSVALKLALILLAWTAVGLALSPSPARGGLRLAQLAAALIITAACAAGADDRRWLDGLHRLSVAAGLTVAGLFWWRALLAFPRSDYPVWLMFSPIGHVSLSGDVLALWLPLLAWTCVETRQPRWLRGGAGLALAGLGGALLMGASRAALAGLALAAVTATTLVVGRDRRWPRRAALPLALAGAAAVGAWAAAPLPLRPLERVVEAFADGVEQRGSWLGPRAPLYAATLELVRAAPLLGYGPGAFPDVYPGRARRGAPAGDPLTAPGLFAADPHNALLEQAVDGGVGAALLLAALLAVVLAGAWQRARRDGGGRAVAAAAALGGALPGLAFSHTLHHPSSLYFFALAAGLSRAASTGAAPPRPAARWRLPAAALLVVTLAIGPTRALAAHWELGRGLAKLGPSPLAARRHLERALACDPRCFRAALALAQLDLAGGDTEAAATRLRQVLTYHPDPALDSLLAAISRR